MRILLTIGYHDILLERGAEAAPILKALDNACLVEKKYITGGGAVYVPKADDIDLSAAIVRDETIQAGDSPPNPILQNMIELAAERDKIRNENCTLKAELEKLKKRIAELVPEPAKE